MISTLTLVFASQGNEDQRQRPGSGCLGQDALLATLSSGQAMEEGLDGCSFKFRKALPLLSLSVALPLSSYTIFQDHPYPVTTFVDFVD